MSLCFRPKSAVRWREHLTKNGKPELVFGLSQIQKLGQLYGEGEGLKVPCGKCIGCQLHRAGEWSLRNMHEARYYERKSFLTLTYRTEELPPHRSLRKNDFQRFMKRLRQELKRKHGIQQTKYFMVGEYGENRERPHYHALLYGYEFPDKQLCKNNPEARDPLYQSEELDRIWGHGYAKIGEVTYDSCNYVARYTMKKTYGKGAEAEYARTSRIAPYNACSKGFGRRYFREFSGDCFPSDYLIHEDTKARVPIPRFYDKLYEALDPEGYAAVKERRLAEAKRAAVAQAKDRTPERMGVREEILLRTAKSQLGRRYEQDRG